ncbi:MAG: gamma-glutamylcyclotransferase [Erysipelotrichia bacterium]|nr:gamma-glutamylcyclotransferase [Erysipelotrichia bacterium]
MTLFVYGTLKKGFENHHFLDGAKFLGVATTKEKYPMVNIVKAYPYLINAKGKGKFVKGEAYVISEQILSRLDLLEGYPEHYDRANITLLVGDTTLEAITYFVNQKIDLSKYELLEEFVKDEFYYGIEIDEKFYK